MQRAISLSHSLWQRRIAVTLTITLLLIVLAFSATYYAVNLPQITLDQQQTLVLGPTLFSPGSSGALRVVVRNQSNALPISDANVIVRLVPKEGGSGSVLYTGKTDARGTAPVAFTVPPDAARNQNLIVETDSNAGRDRVEKAVTVQRSWRILVTTDKPLYQPGQVIHVRALALGALDRIPAKNENIEFLIEDPKGNKIYRKSLSASAYGVVNADFQLADTLNAGSYKITASIGDTKSEKTVTVKSYVLPKFKVTVDTERGYYLPGERVTGHVRADYFFGKPVDKSRVTIKGVVYDVERAETVNLSGMTNAEGVYSFAFSLPNYFAGRGLDKDRADFGLEVSVVDQANHTEQTSLALPIASQPIIIDAVPESGKLVGGVENIVYVLTALPDGSPLETDLTITGATGTTTAHAGKFGLAEVRLTPGTTAGAAPGSNSTVAISARDAQGRTANRQINLQMEQTGSAVLLRADRATYRVGDTMHLDMFATGSVNSVFLDLIKEGQTLSTRALDAPSGRASADVDVTADMIGTLQVHAYQVGRDGTITRDTRVVVVQQPGDLNINVRSDRDTYRPGDTSHVTFAVTDPQGKGVQSALGVSAVDESVFALAEQDPGFAKLYFLLTKELLDPKFQVKGFSLPEVVSEKPVPPAPDIRIAQDQSARAAWAQSTPFDFVLRADSQPEKRAAANKAQQEAYNAITGWLAFALTFVPIALGVLIVWSLHRKKILSRTFAIWMGAALLYCIASPFVVGAIAIFGGAFISARLGVILVAALVFAWLVSLGIPVGYALTRRDQSVQVVLMLLVGYILLLGMLLYVGPRASVFGETAALAVIIAYLIGIGALVLLGVGLLVEKQVAPGIAALLLGVLFIPTTILLAIMPTAGPFLRAMGNPGIYIPPSYLTGCAAAPSYMRSGTGNVFEGLQKDMLSAPIPAPMATSAPQAGAAQKAETQAAPRLRQYFPETLYNNPQVITDENGRAALDIPLADSITTWRLAAMASSQRGELGSASMGLRVFQDFFVDLDLPVALTQNDEISVPVAVYNYLPQAQRVKLSIEKQPWFTLQDEADKILQIESNDIDVVYFRIKAVDFGTGILKVTALGEKMSDAIQREIRVYPNGKLFEASQSNWLKGDTNQVVEIPSAAIPGASRIEVKIFPGIVSQVLNGLDGLLKVPYG